MTYGIYHIKQLLNAVAFAWFIMLENQMEKIESISMLVSWGNQQRPINVMFNSDIKDIKKSIKIVYQLQGDVFYDQQIQYYDSDYQKFIDLFPDGIHAFQNILRKLSSSDAPPKSADDWILKIVQQSVPRQRRKIFKGTVDDTYDYQQEDDMTERPVRKKPPSLRISQSDELNIMKDHTKHDSNPSCAFSKTVGHEMVLEQSLSENTEEDEATNSESTAQSYTINAPIEISTNHLYNLKFDCKIANRQRLQYDKDMNRTSNCKKSKSGGVLLHANARPGRSTTDTVSYPVICFQIPDNQKQWNWYMLFYILTEKDQNGLYYLHASKGIFPGDTNLEQYCGSIKNSESVNPYSVRLTEQHIKNGRFEVRIKVCSITDLAGRKKETLRIFSSSVKCPNLTDLTSSSTNTTMSLNLSSNKYHVACVLLCNEMIYDRCISNITMALSGNKNCATNSTTSKSNTQSNNKLKQN